MKNMKKLAGLMLALIMALALTVPAFAAERKDGTITINNAEGEKEFSIYRIFDMTMDGNNTSAVAYTINPAWSGFFAEGAGGAGYITTVATKDTTPIVVDGAVKYLNITSANVAEFANAAQAYLTTEGLQADGEATVGKNQSSVTIDNLPLGYYLVFPEDASGIKEGNASMCALTSTKPDAEVNVKAVYPTIEKTVEEKSAEVGQLVNYKLTGKVPDTTGYESYTYKVTDTMSAGLTFDETISEFTVKMDGIQIEIPTGALEYKTNPVGFVLTLDMHNYQNNYKGKDIEITYKAKVNSEAIQPGKVDNTAYLEYGHDPAEGLDKTPETSVTTYTATININKVDSNDITKNLQGAEFVLKNVTTTDTENYGKYYKFENGEVKWIEVTDLTVDDLKDIVDVNVTDTEGNAKFEGLKAGDYELIETKAPEGYNKLTEAVKIKITVDEGADKAVVQTLKEGAETEYVTADPVVVKNNTGSLLPDTGGIGTTIFYTVGGILVVGAAILLVTRKRMKSEM